MSTILSANKRIAQQLEKIVSSGRGIQAFAFCGGSKLTRNELGLWLSELLLCQEGYSEETFEHGNCADFVVVEKPEDKESIVKDQILALIEALQFKPYGNRFVVLIKDADKMNESAQNKLLKELEEPTSESVFILLAEKGELLLQTIKSRCSVFHLEEAEDVISEASVSAAKEFAQLSYSNAPYYKKKSVLSYILSDKDNQKALALDFAAALESVYEKDMLSGNKKAASSIPLVEESKSFLEQSFSITYTLKQLCLKL